MSGFRIMGPPREKQHPQASVHSSPNFSQYTGHSPSLAPPAYTTDDLLAVKYHKVARWMYLARIGLAILTLGISAAIVGCTGSSLHEYSSSYYDPQWLLPLWPTTMDLRPTYAVLACGVITIVFSLVYLVIAFIPLRNNLHLLNIASTTIAFLSLFLTLFTAIFASTIISRFSSSASSGSLMSWTCKWQGYEQMAPENFTKICNEGSASLDMVVALIVCSVLTIAASAGGWWSEMMLRRGGVEGETKSQIELVHQV